MSYTYENSYILLKKLFDDINGKRKLEDSDFDFDFDFYDINLIDKTKPNQIYMYITTILKEYPTIMNNGIITKEIYNNFSVELKKYVSIPETKNKSFCDLILFDILCSMKLGKLLQIDTYEIQNDLGDVNFLPNDNIIYKNDNGNDVNIQQFLELKFVKKSLNTINNFIVNFSIPMNKKIKLYKILKILFEKIYDTTKDNGEKILKIFNRLIKDGEITCAPRTIIEGYKDGGKKSNNIEYHICKANFKHTFKKVSGTSARECANKIAKKVLIGNKKSVKFSLKRMIGNKEKCYDYIASIEKGKIVIKNQ